MDLVAGVRKEGSRGGRGDFKWSDVKDSSHRENYLGHSLMAPVGRWQQGKDLQWYTRGEDGPEEAARKEREERQRVKAAEEEAMARVLGLPLPSQNVNLTPLGGGEKTATDGNPAEKTTERDSKDSRQLRRERTRSPERDRDRERDRRGDRDRERRQHRRHDEREHRSHRSHKRRSRSRSVDRDRERRRRRSGSRSRSRERSERDKHGRHRDDRPRRPREEYYRRH
ncbi:kinase phosphorylation protein-domain-containing protein [Aspergillus desertorum]